MNTKIFLLLTCLLTTNPATPVIVKTVTNMPIAAAEQKASAPAKTKESSRKIDLTLPEHTPDQGPDHADKPHKEHEDGKHHTFHFSRVPATKRRYLIVFAGKIGLTLLHICVFIYCFMHVFHP